MVKDLLTLEKIGTQGLGGKRVRRIVQEGNELGMKVRAENWGQLVWNTAESPLFLARTFAETANHIFIYFC